MRRHVAVGILALLGVVLAVVVPAVPAGADESGQPCPDWGAWSEDPHGRRLLCGFNATGTGNQWIVMGPRTRPGPPTATFPASDEPSHHWGCPIGGPVRPAMSPAPAADDSGYWMLESTGVVHAFGDVFDASTTAAWAPWTDGFVQHATTAGFYGFAVADIEPTPRGAGYWLLSASGCVTEVGDAADLPYATRDQLRPFERATSLSATPTGQGYWIFTDQGRALPFGDARALGDLAGTTLNGPVVDSVATPDGAGYYMVASDGGVFAFGTARFHGSMGDTPLNRPVNGLVPDPDGVGYWLVADDGGVFAFQAGFRGSMGGTPLNRPVVGMVAYGDGYLMVGGDGGIFSFSTRPFHGSLGARPRPIVAVAVVEV